MVNILESHTGTCSLSLPSIPDSMFHLAREGVDMNMDIQPVHPITVHILSISTLSKPPHS